MDKFSPLKYLQARIRENRFLDPRTKPTYEQDQEEKAKIKIKAQSLNQEIHPKTDLASHHISNFPRFQMRRAKKGEK